MEEIAGNWQLVGRKYCPRCILRHTASTLMQNVICESEDDIIDQLNSLHATDFKELISKREKGFVCSACLGLLQDSHLQMYVEDVVTALRMDCYDFPSFQLLYTLPVQMMVLDAVASADFAKLSKDLDDEPKDVKQVMKVFFRILVTRKSEFLCSCLTAILLIGEKSYQ